ncbi:MAG: electron transport complex subunit RsxB [Gammaproteobacteria bacterium]|jgi:electron transport complex protein RnfB
MLSAILALGILSALFGLLLGYAAIRFKVEGDPIVDQIDALLPQTQCGQCGFAGCRPYAEAIAAGEADINQCPPGGDSGIQALAELLGVDPKPLNAEHGETREHHVAIIDEQTCIGCTLCIQACPVDAILGAAKQMHTVIESECTGCELCVAPCPVDCISMVPVEQDIDNWKWPSPESEVQPSAAVGQA